MRKQEGDGVGRGGEWVCVRGLRESDRDKNKIFFLQNEKKITYMQEMLVLGMVSCFCKEEISIFIKLAPRKRLPSLFD